MFEGDFLRVLHIDLNTSSFSVSAWPDLRPLLGGVGIAAKLMLETAAWEREPLDPEQPVIFAIGPLSGIFPLATKVAAVFRSPLTGEWGESYAGMRGALAMRFAGYDAVVIQGRAARPTYLRIDREGVFFKDARGLWGLDVEQTGRLLREFEPGRGHRSTWRIGPAGENLVHFAGVNVDTFRHFGRMGLGAVFGSKNLKAVVVDGTKTYPIRDPKAYNAAYEAVYREVVGTPQLAKYHQVGTAENVMRLNETGSLPTMNLRAGRFDAAGEISGETFAEKSLTRILACTGCPVGCIHIGIHRQRHPEGFGYISTTIAYDYEPIYALGPMLGLDSTEKIYALLEVVEALGLDVISTGVALAWATEAFGRSIIGERETLTPLEFGDERGYIAAARHLTSPPNQFYADLAKGLAYAASRYGGEDFALTLGGHEMAGYHTGYGFLLGHSAGARHSHLCNAGYAFDLKYGADFDDAALVNHLITEEEWRNVLNSLVVCLFARGVYTQETTVRVLGSIGIRTSPEELKAVGQEIFRLKWEVKRRLGYSLDSISIPKRYFETPSGSGLLKPQRFEQLLGLYRERLAEELNLAL
ncbi:MAG TPA: aldehyde:ferredoxin oxidoreductase [Desulfotomaculum sp.]|nr:aldehyde:ferredoxin oxidoreductase [Desulfotomaculum sp.]